MQEDLTALLLAAPTIAALVDTRVHWGRLPATVQGRPYINMAVISDPRSYHFQGATGLRQTRVQFDIWAESATSAKDVAAAVEALLSGFRGVVGVTNFRGVFLDAERDLTGDTAGENVALFRRVQDYNINWFLED